MMTIRKLTEYLSAEPFRPFRVKMTSGEAYDIRHPEMMMVGRSSARVYATRKESEHERWHDLSMLLMESIEPIETSVAR